MIEMTCFAVQKTQPRISPITHCFGDLEKILDFLLLSEGDTLTPWQARPSETHANWQTPLFQGDREAQGLTALSLQNHVETRGRHSYHREKHPGEEGASPLLETAPPITRTVNSGCRGNDWVPGG